MFAHRMSRVAPSAIMELIKATADGNYISFASGLPDPALFPVAELRRVTAEVLAEDGPAALQYGPAEGYAPLRELVAELLCARGLRAQPEQVLITTGSQQALDLAARAVLEPGSEVLIENPTYLAALQVFDSHEAHYHRMEMDDEGMVVEDLDTALGHWPKLVYTLPNYQNPTGITMSLERRLELARGVAAAGITLVEDDAYHDLWYDAPPPPPVCALAENPWALYTGTFSKVIAPGLRIGYLWGNARVVSRLAQLKQLTDLHSSSLAQRVIHRYCRQGLLDPGIRRFRDGYRRRRDVMLASLETHLGGLARWTVPAGGMFLFVTLPEQADAEELLRRCMARGVVFVPGGSFHPGGGGEHTLRLNFVSASEERIREGIALLGEEVRKCPA